VWWSAMVSLKEKNENQCMIRSECRFSERKLDVDIIHYNTKLASMSVVGGIWNQQRRALESFFCDPFGVTAGPLGHIRGVAPVQLGMAFLQLIHCYPFVLVGSEQVHP
jgi:hypothetical protein